MEGRMETVGYLKSWSAAPRAGQMHTILAVPLKYKRLFRRRDN